MGPPRFWSRYTPNFQCGRTSTESSFRTFRQGNLKLNLYNTTKAGTFLVANREFTTLNAERFENGICYMVARSIPSDVDVFDTFPSQLGDVGNTVRSHILYLGQAIVPISENVCQYWCITQVDPAGWIPATLYNWVTRFLPREFQTTMKKGCFQRLEQTDKYLNYYRSQAPEFKSFK
jgi:hypothetical protein